MYNGKLNIKYVYQKNSGVSSPICNAYNISTGKYVIKMDSDDLFTEDGLNFILKTLKENLDREAFLFASKRLKNNVNFKIYLPMG